MVVDSFCLERHANELKSCDRAFVSKQALEGHRKRTGCEPWKLTSSRASSKYSGLEPEDARELKRQSNRAAVSKYRTTVDGERAVHRARHIAKFRLMARNTMPAPPMPKAPAYMRPPISWLIADAEIFAQDLKERFDHGEIVLRHATWSLRFHTDKVEVIQHVCCGLNLYRVPLLNSQTKSCTFCMNQSTSLDIPVHSSRFVYIQCY
jgi:hypothetical protein